MRGSATAVVALTLAACVLAGRATAAVPPDLPPVPPVWAPVTDVSPAPAPRGAWAIDVAVGPAVVRVQVPEAYARTADVEHAFARWAIFLGTLVHGDELGSVRLTFALSRELARACGAEALACYLPHTRELYLPTQAPAGWAFEHVVAHEYGHHVAAARDNAPWPAFGWGTKRWATLVGVCSKVVEASADPFGLDWEATPGEAFAETYRLLNARRTWGAAPGWMFGAHFRFDAATLKAVELDVLKPWRPTLADARSGRLISGRSAHVRLTVPFDGTVQLRLRAAPRGSLLRVANADPAAPGGTQIDATVCGNRTLDIEVRAPRSGRFVLEALG